MTARGASGGLADRVLVAELVEADLLEHLLEEFDLASRAASLPEGWVLPPLARRGTW